MTKLINALSKFRHIIGTISNTLKSATLVPKVLIYDRRLFCKLGHLRAVVVVKRSALAPFTPTIRVRIPLKSTVSSSSLFDINESKQKDAGNGPLKTLGHLNQLHHLGQAWHRSFWNNDLFINLFCSVESPSTQRRLTTWDLENFCVIQNSPK